MPDLNDLQYFAQVVRHGGFSAAWRDEVRGSLRVSYLSQLPHILGPGPLTTFLTRYPLVRVQLHLSNRRVDLINERYDIAFRIQSDFDTDQSLTLRRLGSSRLVLVAEPSLLAGRIIRTPEDLALVSTISMGEHMSHRSRAVPR